MADDGHGHGLAHVHRTLSKVDRPGPSRFQAAHHIQHLMDGTLGTVEGAASTAVAQLGEDEYLLADHGDGVPHAHLGATLAEGAAVQVYLGDEDAHLLVLVQARLQKERRVGFFDVTVQEQDRVRDGQRQAGSHRRLARAALAARYCDDHL